MVGLAEGETEGAGVGGFVGCFVGCFVGSLLGEGVGSIVGPLLGGSVGSLVGPRLGAAVSATGAETTTPQTNSTTTTHKSCYQPGHAETYPMVELKISIARDLDALQRVMDAILDAHHYEEPVIFVREDWASRADYDPNGTNPNRWWNDGRGLPDTVEFSR